MLWKLSVGQILSKKLKKNIEITSVLPVGGGDINETYKIETNTGTFFVKLNSAVRFPKMFEKEAKGLYLLASANTISVPEVVATGTSNNKAFLILEFIDSNSKKTDFWEQFAQGLAGLHRHSSNYFGLDYDNYIGSLPQSNKKHDNWPNFFMEERLQIQVKMARDNRNIDRNMVLSFERFYQKLPELFPQEPPALVHGDLWSGNYMTNQLGNPVLIDPAVYYGHREMDLGMTQLFGGFDHEFYEAYQRYYPLEKGWQQRLNFCNLYPLMVHVNLFGGGYTASVQTILQKF